MQRITFKNSRGLRLVGNFSPTGSNAVIVMAHGFTSDKSSRGRFDMIAQSLNRAGYSTLAFDFSGCGESADDSLTAAKQVDDLRAAIAYVHSHGFRRVGLWGHSLGGRICLQTWSPEVATMVLTGAGSGPMYYEWSDYYPPEQLQELGETGRLTVRLSEGPRREIVIDAQMFRDFAEFDRQSILDRIKCPVLFVHGDAEPEERQLLQHSFHALTYLPPESHVEVIPGADHTFMDHIDRLIELGRSWLTRHLPLDGK
jgi:pimeloyl-ACP methyl ester carboxylesterase